MHRRPGKCVVAALAVAVVGSVHGAFAQVSSSSATTLDSALVSAVNTILVTIERAGVPCDLEGALPVAIWPLWQHRPGQSTLREDRGFGEFLARQIEARLPCPTAVQGADRDQLLRELQVQAQPFYDSSHPRFRTAGREFARSLYVVAGDWWKTETGSVVFTTQVYHLLRGERLPAAVTQAEVERTVSIASIPNQKIREGLYCHVCVDIPETFDAEAERDLGFGRRPSVLQSVITDSLGSSHAVPCELVVVGDSANADVVISGTVSYLTCPTTPVMREILGNSPSYAYRTETRLEIHWCSGRSAVWTSQAAHPCPPLMGPVRRRNSPAEAYTQARGWLTTGGAPPVASAAVAWVFKTICAD